jgi:hypothetical protein
MMEVPVCALCPSAPGPASGSWSGTEPGPPLCLAVRQFWVGRVGLLAGQGQTAGHGMPKWRMSGRGVTLVEGHQTGEKHSHQLPQYLRAWRRTLLVSRDAQRVCPTVEARCSGSRVGHLEAAGVASHSRAQVLFFPSLFLMKDFFDLCNRVRVG